MTPLQQDAEAIWQAALTAVAPQALVASRLTVVDDQLLCDGQPLAPAVRLRPDTRIVAVGGGKAAAGLAAGVEQSIPAEWTMSGLIGVPEGCGRTLPRLSVREVRPAGRNEPTTACVAATEEMLAMLAGLGPEDVAIALVTGGGSAILTAPLPGIPLDEVVAATRWLSDRGADISQLNQVRQAVSQVKAGGLARACGAGRLVVLVISDVIGDPLATISSGPCMPVAVDAREVLEIAERFGLADSGVAPGIVARLRDAAATQAAAPRPVPPAAAIDSPGSRWRTTAGCEVSHHLLASNATSVAAAAAEATRLGYQVTLRHADPARSETANEVGRRLAAEGLATLAAEGPPRTAIIEGGEAIVRLPEPHGVGGRNQQTVAAAAAWLLDHRPWPDGLLIASLGTDGEDGPTSAAGGIVDAGVASAINRAGLNVREAAARCDAFPLLESAGGLIRTGPTGTNVADVRMVLVDRSGTPHTSQACTASLRPANGSRVGMNSWPTKPGYSSSTSFRMMAG